MVVPDEALDKYPKAAEIDGGKVAFGIRPENFAPPEEVGPGQVWSGAEVSLVEMLGAEMLIHFKTSASPIVTEDMKAAIDDDEAFEELERQAREGGQEFVARFDPGEQAKAGQPKDVGVKTEHLHFFDIDTGQTLR